MGNAHGEPLEATKMKAVEGGVSGMPLRVEHPTTMVELESKSDG